jgi:predicted transcriptional regulator of viral defense system
MIMSSQPDHKPVTTELPSLAVAHNEADRQRYHRMFKQGLIERPDRGLYLVNPSRWSPDHELAAVAVRKPEAVICCHSAAHFHHLTTYVPEEVQIGMPSSRHPPRWKWPRIEPITIDMDPSIGGIDIHVREGIPIKVTSPARTIPELWRHQERVLPNVYQEILRSVLERKLARPSDILPFAKRFRVEREVSLMIQTVFGP